MSLARSNAGPRLTGSGRPGSSLGIAATPGRGNAEPGLSGRPGSSPGISATPVQVSAGPRPPTRPLSPSPRGSGNDRAPRGGGRQDENLMEKFCQQKTRQQLEEDLARKDDISAGMIPRMEQWKTWPGRLPETQTEQCRTVPDRLWYPCGSRVQYISRG